MHDGQRQGRVIVVIQGGRHSNEARKALRTIGFSRMVGDRSPRRRVAVRIHFRIHGPVDVGLHVRGRLDANGCLDVDRGFVIGPKRDADDRLRILDTIRGGLCDIGRTVFDLNALCIRRAVVDLRRDIESLDHVGIEVRSAGHFRRY